jgi:hypothetical protein
VLLLLLPLLLKFFSFDILAAVVTVVVVIVLLLSNFISKLDAGIVEEFDCLLFVLDDDILVELSVDSNDSIFFDSFGNLLLVLFIYFLYDS